MDEGEETAGTIKSGSRAARLVRLDSVLAHSIPTNTATSALPVDGHRMATRSVGGYNRDTPHCPPSFVFLYNVER